MKSRILVVLLLCLIVTGLAFAADSKMLVRIEGLSSKEMKAYLGSDYDLAKTGRDYVELVMTTEEFVVMKKAGRRVRALIDNLDTYVARRLAAQTPQATYYTYETVTSTLQEWAARYSAIARLSSIGKSCEGRDLWAMKVTTDPDRNIQKPACLVTGAHHAREWISVEVPMAALKAYLEGYGTDERITRLVSEREVWFVPMVNPDGVTFSQKGSRYWRKNRRPLPGNQYFGVDLNRNYGYHWGMTGSSDQFYSDTYHGPNAFSEPETLAVKALAESRRFQTALSFHSYSELILYPFAYAYNVPNPDEPLFQSVGAQMAEFNKYTVQNCTDLYPCMGISDDWLYGELKTLAFTIELAQEFIPPPAQIAAINAINVPATMVLIERTGPLAVLSRSADTAHTARLDFVDGVAALELGARLLGRSHGEVREHLAARVQSVANRVGALVSEQLLCHDRSGWQRLTTAGLDRFVAANVRSRLMFEACYGNPAAGAALAEVVPAAN